jgi:hypothetical protein
MLGALIDYKEIIITILCCLSGLAVHTLKDMQRSGLTVGDYLFTKRIDLISTMLVAFTVILAEYDTIEPLFAFTLGYTSNSGIEWIMKKPNVR